MPIGPNGKRRPRDPIQLGKLAVDIATGQVADPKNAAVKLGRRGGIARKAALSPQRRHEIAQKAAAPRWGKGCPPA